MSRLFFKINRLLHGSSFKEVIRLRLAPRALAGHQGGVQVREECFPAKTQRRGLTKVHIFTDIIKNGCRTQRAKCFPPKSFFMSRTRRRGPVTISRLVTRLTAHAARHRENGCKAGTAALRYGPSLAARAFGRSLGFVQYHKHKVLQPHFHSGSHGGFRWARFSPKQRLLISHRLWRLVSENPTHTLHYYTVRSWLL